MRAPGRERLTHRWLRRPGGPAVRLAGSVVLLVLAALGCAARGVTHLSTAGTLTAGSGPAGFSAGVAAVVTACLVLAGLIVLLSRRRRPRDEFPRVAGPVGPWWARALALLAALALIALPVAAVVATLHRRRGSQQTLEPVVPVMPRIPGATPSAGAAGTAFLAGALATLAVLAAAALALTVLWLRRRRRAAAAGGGPAAASPLAVAVAAGIAALGAESGAREAIIACYAAMVATLAAAGSPRRAADTPEETLSRAERDGIIRTPAARRLTALFREARFSPHHLTGADRHAAQEALDDIGRDLAGNGAPAGLAGRP